MRYVNLELQEVPLEAIEERINKKNYPNRKVLVALIEAISQNERDEYIDSDYKDQVHQILFSRLSQVIQVWEN